MIQDNLLFGGPGCHVLQSPCLGYIDYIPEGGSVGNAELQKVESGSTVKVASDFGGLSRIQNPD